MGLVKSLATPPTKIENLKRFNVNYFNNTLTNWMAGLIEIKATLALLV